MLPPPIARRGRTSRLHLLLTTADYLVSTYRQPDEDVHRDERHDGATHVRPHAGHRHENQQQA
eukprot:scaffold81952_cov61-Phaeocystis_antarctica.AAC.5